MRELERRQPAPTSSLPALRHVAVVGAGRLGTALTRALRDAAVRVDGPLRRDATIAPEAALVILAVPDAAIASAARRVAPGPLLAHCSGATPLDVLGPRPRLSLHPLMTIAPDADPRILRGATAAIDGSDERALAVARALAAALGMREIRIADADRAAYHAAASIAANFLITLEDSAERIGATAGLSRAALVPLVRAAVDAWAATGAPRALTGPVARGDEATIARQRLAIAQRTPELLALFDALTAATRALAGSTARTPDSEAVPC